MSADARTLGRDLVEFLWNNGPWKDCSLSELARAFDVRPPYFSALLHQRKTITVDRASRYLRLAQVEHGYPLTLIIVDPESSSCWIELRNE